MPAGVFRSTRFCTPEPLRRFSSPPSAILGLHLRRSVHVMAFVSRRPSLSCAILGVSSGRVLQLHRPDGSGHKPSGCSTRVIHAHVMSTAALLGRRVRLIGGCCSLVGALASNQSRSVAQAGMQTPLPGAPHEFMLHSGRCRKRTCHGGQFHPAQKLRIVLDANARLDPFAAVSSRTFAV